MKYPKITALVPSGEEFNADAVNEGIWLTAAHVDAIEATVANAEAAAATQAEIITAANELIAEGQTLVNAANATIAANATELVALQAEVTKLKGTPADVVATSVAEDKLAVDTTKPDPKAKYRTSYDSHVESAPKY